MLSFLIMSCTVNHESIDTSGDMVLSFTQPTGNNNSPGIDQVYYISKNGFYIQSKDIPSIIIQAKYLREHPNSMVLVIGNTDTVGSRAFDFALGWQCAEALANILLEQGVLPNQINVVSYGKENPLDLWHEREGSLNRRVILHYYEK